MHGQARWRSLCPLPWHLPRPTPKRRPHPPRGPSTQTAPEGNDGKQSRRLLPARPPDPYDRRGPASLPKQQRDRAIDVGEQEHCIVLRSRVPLHVGAKTQPAKRTKWQLWSTTPVGSAVSVSTMKVDAIVEHDRFPSTTYRSERLGQAAHPGKGRPPANQGNRAAKQKALLSSPQKP